MENVSIIMPVYNKEEYIYNSIESVLKQSYKKFKLIIVNDGSIDNSKKIILKYMKLDHRIMYIEQDNMGVSMARNTGIDVAESEYICFLDSDDDLDEHFLKRMLTNINNSNVCYCGNYNIINGKKIKSRMKFYEGDILNKYLYNKCIPNANSWLIRREFLDKYNIRFTEGLQLGEDIEFFSKVLLHDKNVRCTNAFLTNYHRDTEGSLSENTIDKIYADITWMEKLRNYILNNEMSIERRDKILRALDTYRIPGSLISRMNSNRRNVDPNQITELLKSFNKYLNNLKMSNGIRSLKLYVLFYILKFSSIINSK